jgi:hypothetical protein
MIVKRVLSWSAAVIVPAAVGLIAGNAPRPSGPSGIPDRLGSVDAGPSAEYLTVCRRLEWRLEIVADLLAGRVTVAEAHARFLDANRSDPRAIRNLRNVYSGQTDEERTARQLFGYIRVSDHPRAEEVSAAVRCEWLGSRPSQVVGPANPDSAATH